MRMHTWARLPCTQKAYVVTHLPRMSLLGRANCTTINGNTTCSPLLFVHGLEYSGSVVREWSGVSPTGLSNYEIVRRLGQGGMGEVFEAVHRTLGRRVALKMIREDLVLDRSIQKRFLREAESLAQVEHENVVRLYELFEEDGAQYIVMEFVDGGDLNVMTRTHPGAWPLEVALNLLVGIASGLAAAHAHGIVHRDVKPSNVLISRQGCPKLTDFGLALRDRAETRVTMHGRIVGTVGYMSPEQWASATVTSASDVFSLGLLAHRVLVGALPLGESRGAEAATRQSIKLPPIRASMPHFPQSLGHLVDDMLAIDPSYRPSAHDVADGLERILLEVEPRPATRAVRQEILERFLALEPDPIGAGHQQRVPSASSAAQRWRHFLWIPLVIAALALSGVALVRFFDKPLPHPTSDSSDIGEPAWLALRFPEPVIVHSASDSVLAMNDRSPVLTMSPGVVSGLWASNARFPRASLPEFVLAPGETLVTPLLPLWGLVRIQSEPAGLPVTIDEGTDEGATPVAFYLAAGPRTVRVTGRGHELLSVDLVQDSRVVELPFAKGRLEDEYEFTLPVGNGTFVGVGMVFRSPPESQ
jgi:serine/threonine protein kinase